MQESNIQKFRVDENDQGTRRRTEVCIVQDTLRDENRSRDAIIHDLQCPSPPLSSRPVGRNFGAGIF